MCRCLSYTTQQTMIDILSFCMLWHCFLRGAITSCLKFIHHSSTRRCMDWQEQSRVWHTANIRKYQKRELRLIPYTISVPSCRLDSVLAEGEVNLLLALLQGLKRRLVLGRRMRLCQTSDVNNLTFVNRLRIARVFFVRRSRGAYFFFL